MGYRRLSRWSVTISKANKYPRSHGIKPCDSPALRPDWLRSPRLLVCLSLMRIPSKRHSNQRARRYEELGHEPVIVFVPPEGASCGGGRRPPTCSVRGRVTAVRGHLSPGGPRKTVTTPPLTSMRVMTPWRRESGRRTPGAWTCWARSWTR